MKSNRGGARKGAGRKKVSDKMKPVTIWVRDSVINSIGLDNLKTKLYAAL